MPIPIYVSREFTASAVGSQLKECVCEKCGTRFWYELSRVGMGRGSAPYMIGQKGAQTRAQTAAAEDVARRLSRDLEMVPCPSCHWIDEAAIRQHRRTQYRRFTGPILFALLLGPLINVIVFATSRDVLAEAPTLRNPIHWIIAAVWIAVGGGLWLIQRALRNRIDPNRLANGKKALPPGTPPALLPKKTAEDGTITFEPVPYETSDAWVSAKWATCRANQLQLPRLCCRCLGAPSQVLHLPFVAQAQPMEVPLCKACATAIRIQWWVSNIASVVLAFVIAWCIARLGGFDQTGRWMATVFMGCFLGGVGFCLIDHFIRPYRNQVVDLERGIARIWFRNPAYTALIIRMIAEADGLAERAKAE